MEGLVLISKKHLIQVWHKGVIFRLKQNGICGKLPSVLYDFLEGQKQRVTLNRQLSSWTGDNAKVPQGSRLGLLLFLVHTNDPADSLPSNAKLFAANTSLFLVIHDVGTSSKELNNDFYRYNNE